MAEATQASLLQWSVMHSQNTQHQQQKQQQIDSKWVDVILGKKDAVKMKESVAIVEDVSRTLEDRVAAFDELEMLIESGDNARDLRPLDLWTPVLSLLASGAAHPRLRFYAAWVVGTAVQNDEKVQNDFLDIGGLEVLIPALASESDIQVLAKLIYALSSLIRNNPRALSAISSNNGFASLRALLSTQPTASPLAPYDEPDSPPINDPYVIHKRVIALLTSIFNDRTPESFELLEVHGFARVVCELVEAEVGKVPAVGIGMVDFIEKAMQFVGSVARLYASAGKGGDGNVRKAGREFIVDAEKAVAVSRRCEGCENVVGSAERVLMILKGIASSWPL
ncbi:armadillo-type protein [Cladochytrium replicatum]|nr:armadillo-type protein [Cladochytrium replicatum]